MAGAPVVRISTIAAKQQHPSWSHAGRLPWAEASLQPRKPEQQEHSHTPCCGSAAHKQGSEASVSKKNQPSVKL